MSHMNTMIKKDWNPLPPIKNMVWRKPSPLSPQVQCLRTTDVCVSQIFNFLFHPCHANKIKCLEVNQAWDVTLYRKKLNRK